jgi:hypothetical protein
VPAQPFPRDIEAIESLVAGPPARQARVAAVSAFRVRQIAGDRLAAERHHRGRPAG